MCKQLILCLIIIVGGIFHLIACRRKTQIITADDDDDDEIFDKSVISLKIVQRTFKMPPLASARSRNSARVTPELGVSCSLPNITKSLQSLSKKVGCMPRDTIVSVTASDESIVFPDTVVVKRCNGMCSGKHKCRPSKKAPVEFYVQTTNPVTSLVFCNVIKVDEDISCRCSCGKKQKCGAAQKFNNKSCKCVCKNLVDYNECISRTDQIWEWDSKMCSCKCKYKKICTTGSVWDADICRCVKK